MQANGDPGIPLAPRWRAWSVGALRAGATAIARLSLENAGAATWRSRGRNGVQLGYHWLDPLGNPIVWDGARTPLPHPVGPGETVDLEPVVTAPRPPGRYRLAFDLVEEHRFWFAELGCKGLDIEVEVAPRIVERRLRVVVHGGDDAATRDALARQDEALVDGDAEVVAHLVAGAVPAADWSRRVLDAHAEGWAAVGPGLVTSGRQRARLAAWAAGGGRNPRLGLPLLLPSLLEGLEPTEHEGLPAYAGDDGLFDGRIAVTLPPQSGRRHA